MSAGNKSDLAARERATPQATLSRGKQFSYALASSVGAKAAAAMVQIVAMPVAAAALGSHGFALFAMLTAAVGWLALANVGIGPALVVGLAGARASNSIAAEKYVTSALAPLCLFTGAAAIGALLLVWSNVATELFGPAYANDADTVKIGLSLLIGLFVAQSILSVYESAQTAYQEQHVCNGYLAAGSLLCVAATVFVASNSSKVVAILVAMTVPQALCRIVNAANFARAHGAANAKRSRFDKNLSVSLLKSGASFSLAGGVANVLAHIYPVLLVGRTSPPDVTAAFAATMNLVLLASGITAMLSTPLWAPIADSVARREAYWARRAYRQLLWVTLLIGFLLATFLITKGPWLFQVWFRGVVTPSSELTTAAALYLFVLCWEASHFSILIGLGHIYAASWLICLRAVVGAALAVAWTAGSPTIPFLAMTIATLLVSAIPLRVMVVKKLAELD